MKYAIYEAVYTKARTPTEERWTVRLDVIGTVEHCDTPEQAMQAARAAGFLAPIVGEWKEELQ